MNPVSYNNDVYDKSEWNTYLGVKKNQLEGNTPMPTVIALHWISWIIFKSFLFSSSPYSLLCIIGLILKWQCKPWRDITRQWYMLICQMKKISSEVGETTYTKDSQGSFGGNEGNGQTLKSWEGRRWICEWLSESFDLLAHLHTSHFFFVCKNK